jgi:protein-tyrosine phosphatase
MGNICRSPTVEGVFVDLVGKSKFADAFKVDSAGTHAYHVGDAPDLRAQRAARDRGVELKNLRARQVRQSDYKEFDYILMMDEENYQNVEQDCPDEFKHKLGYLLDYAPQFNTREVPDPYYGGAYGFERVLDMAEAASEGLLKTLLEKGDLK